MNISNFNTVIHFINIKNNESKNLYFDLLNKRHDNIISKGIRLLTDSKINEEVHIVAKIAFYNYIYEVRYKYLSLYKKELKNYVW